MALSVVKPRRSAMQLVPFAALSATYFAHIGFFNPYLPLWLKGPGLAHRGDQPADLGAEFHARVCTLCLGRPERPHRRARAPAAYQRGGGAAVIGRAVVQRGGAWWIGIVLLVLFTHTSSMMSLTEAAMAHLVAGDWGRYGRIRLWGSAGFMLTVFAAGAWFERHGMKDFPAWTAVTLGGVLLCTWWLPDVREKHAHADVVKEPIGPVLRQPVVRWFFASLLFHVMAHFPDLRLPVAVPGFAGLQQGHDRHVVGGVGAGGDRLVLCAGAADRRPEHDALAGGVRCSYRGAHGADRRPGRLASGAVCGAGATCADLCQPPHGLHRHGEPPFPGAPARARAGAVHPSSAMAAAAWPACWPAAPWCHGLALS